MNYNKETIKVLLFGGVQKSAKESGMRVQSPCSHAVCNFGPEVNSRECYMGSSLDRNPLPQVRGARLQGYSSGFPRSFRVRV